MVHIRYFMQTCFVLRKNSSDWLNQVGIDGSASPDCLFLNIAPYTPPLIRWLYTATGVKLAGLKMYTNIQFLEMYANCVLTLTVSAF